MKAFESVQKSSTKWSKRGRYSTNSRRTSRTVVADSGASRLLSPLPETSRGANFVDDADAESWAFGSVREDAIERSDTRLICNKVGDVPIAAALRAASRATPTPTVDHSGCRSRQRGAPARTSTHFASILHFSRLCGGSENVEKSDKKSHLNDERRRRERDAQVDRVDEYRAVSMLRLICDANVSDEDGKRDCENLPISDC